MADILRQIATRRFNGDVRRGPRRAYIARQLASRGISHSTDSHGNVWVERGCGSRLILLSSHMDVDTKIRDMRFSTCREGNKRIVVGVLDNAVGCYVNLLLATGREPHGTRVMHVFTASEEVSASNPRLYCRSAREVVKTLRERGIRPDMCIALDATFPRLLLPEHMVGRTDDYHKLFDVEDRTHCYADGYSRRVAKKMAEYHVRRFRSPNVALRKLAGHDEAFVYRRLAPAFAFGPVVYGHFDRHDQWMPISHLDTALAFLRRLLE